MAICILIYLFVNFKDSQRTCLSFYAQNFPFILFFFKRKHACAYTGDAVNLTQLNEWYPHPHPLHQGGSCKSHVTVPSHIGSGPDHAPAALQVSPLLPEVKSKPPWHLTVTAVPTSRAVDENCPLASGLSGGQRMTKEQRDKRVRCIALLAVLTRQT